MTKKQKLKFTIWLEVTTRNEFATGIFRSIMNQTMLAFSKLFTGAKINTRCELIQCSNPEQNQNFKERK